MQAIFDREQHAVEPGWATYHARRNQHGWRRLICFVRGHIGPRISAKNGYSPSDYARCERCQNAIKWYVIGQHRYGGL